jgi:hypothetical protein
MDTDKEKVSIRKNQKEGSDNNSESNDSMDN